MKERVATSDGTRRRACSTGIALSTKPTSAKPFATHGNPARATTRVRRQHALGASTMSAEQYQGSHGTEEDRNPEIFSLEAQARLEVVTHNLETWRQRSKARHGYPT